MKIMAENSSSSSGIGVLGLLGVVFVTLKLLGKIDWSWWWVTVPFWGGIAIFIAGLIIYLLVKLISRGIDYLLSKPWKK